MFSTIFLDVLFSDMDLKTLVSLTWVYDVLLDLFATIEVSKYNLAILLCPL